MTAARQTLLSMGFSRQEYWNGFATSFARASSLSRDRTRVSCIGRRTLLPLSHQGSQTPVPAWLTWEPSFGVQGTSMIRTLVTRGRARAELPGDASVFSDFELGGGEGAREMQLAFKKILLFSVILPLASLEGQGCHVTCCQGPASAWRKCGRPR